MRMARYSFEDYRKEQAETWGLVWQAIIAAFFAAGPLLLIFQAFEWLRYGGWPPITIGSWLSWTGTAVPRLSWVGAERLWEWVLATPLWIVCPLIGLACLFLSVAINEAHEKRAG